MCFYDKFTLICEQRGVAKTRALIDAGLSKSLAAKWEKKKEKGENVVPNGETLLKLCNYFGVASDYFLDDEIEKAPTLSGEDSEFDSIFSQLNEQNKKIALVQLKALLDNQ